MSNVPTAAALKNAANEARNAWIARAASVGRDETPNAINFAFDGGKYRAEFGKRGMKIFEIWTQAVNLRYGNRPENRVV
jgi:hypothetical protein